ncbi:MAG: hypothetical protein KDK55_06290 [Chlamydiia bacterium]|nr:hypothetical protein [Chlamydiia bacterium]
MSFISHLFKCEPSQPFEEGSQSKTSSCYGKEWIPYALKSKKVGDYLSFSGVCLLIITMIIGPLCLSHVIAAPVLVGALVTGVGGGIGLFLIGSACVVYSLYYKYNPDGRAEISKN